ncbi:MAG: glycosyltransferase family 4 protein, partial [Geminicoccaceae bacterium]|nr:glycosyltransferase family 4 protein [Geminicoccaceae bacterium]
MRILALAQDGFGGFGGVARYDAAFLAALAQCERVDEVVVVARGGSGKGRPARCRQFGPFPSKAAFVAAVFATVVRARRFDLVWCGHINLAPLALAVARGIGCPWWLQLHGIDAWKRPARLRAEAAERADLVLAVSRYTRERFLAWANIEPARVKVVPNTVEERFSPGPRSPALLARYGIEGRRVLLTVARLSKSDGYKGVDLVLCLLPELKDRIPNLAYLVVGDGDDRPRLERLARELGVAGQVRFVGRVPDEELVDHYRLADLFVMPSKKEGFGIVFLEAMACGVPALGLNVDGSVDPLSLEPLGHAVAEPELASTIARLLADPPPRQPRPRIGVFSKEAFRTRVSALVE